MLTRRSLTRSLAATLALMTIFLGALSCKGDSSTNPDPSGLQGTWTGTAFFGFASQPQPIQITVDSNGQAFGGSVVTDHVADGPIGSGAWNGAKATWITTEKGHTSQWEATVSGATLTGSVLSEELSFTATRL